MLPIIIDGVTYSLPVSLHEITLGQRIDWDATYGADLREKLKAILEMEEDDLVREGAMLEYQCDLACKTLSFFGSIPLDIVRQTKIDDVLIFYSQTMKAFSDDVDFTSEDYVLSALIAWNNDQWQIGPPVLKHNSAMTFDEFITAKQWVKNLLEFSGQKWDALLMLACVYFRKQDEPYHEDLAAEDGERIKLLRSLPFDYALGVGFFLSASMRSYMKTLNSFSLQAEVVPLALN